MIIAEKKTRKPPWRAEEVRLLQENFATTDTRQLAEKLGRPLSAVRQKAYTLGLKTDNRPRPWSGEETKLLRKLYPNMSSRDIACRIGRSASSVSQRAVMLGFEKSQEYLESLGRTGEVKPWTARDIELVKKMYPIMKASEVADYLGRSRSMVTKYACSLGLKKKKHVNWSEDEIKLLIQEYYKKTAKQIAKELGRSINSVREKAHRLGLRKKGPASQLTHQLALQETW